MPGESLVTSLSALTVTLTWFPYAVPRPLLNLYITRPVRNLLTTHLVRRVGSFLPFVALLR